MGFFPGKKTEALDPKAETMKNTPPAEQTLSDVVRGMAHAASAADEIIDQQFIKQLDNFFDVVPETGKLRAKMVQVELGPDRIIEVPLITMVDPALLSLDEVTVAMVVKLTQCKVAEMVHLADNEQKVTRSSFGVTMTSAAPDSRSDGLRVSMKFKRIAPPEGATRIIDEMASMIAPRDKDRGIAMPSMTQTFANPSGSHPIPDEPKSPPPADPNATGEFPPTDLG